MVDSDRASLTDHVGKLDTWAIKINWLETRAIKINWLETWAIKINWLEGGYPG